MLMWGHTKKCQDISWINIVSKNKNLKTLLECLYYLKQPTELRQIYQYIKYINVRLCRVRGNNLKIYMQPQRQQVASLTKSDTTKATAIKMAYCWHQEMTYISIKQNIESRN